MAFTYSGNPSTVRRDAIRLLIGDTDPDDILLQDDEITYFTDAYGSDRRAAGVAARAVAAKFTRLIDRSIGDLDASFSQKADNYNELADLLLGETVLDPTHPILSGVSKSERRLKEQDDDRIPNHARVGVMDNYRAAEEDYLRQYYDYGYNP